MNTSQFAALCALSVGAAFSGSYAAARKDLPADAQTQVRTQVQNFVFVPDDGLRFVSTSGKVLAIIGQQDGNGGFMLVDAAGRASVTMVAAQSGQATLAGSQGGMSLELSPLDGSALAQIIAASSGSHVSLMRGSTQTARLQVAADGAQVALSATPGASLFASATAKDSVISAIGTPGKPAFSLITTAGGGSLTLNDTTGRPAVEANPDGSIRLSKEGAVTWKAPGEGQGG